MAQWLGALDACVKIPDVLPSTRSCLELQFYGIQCSLLFFTGAIHAQSSHTHMQADTRAHEIKQILQKKNKPNQT